MSHSTARRRLGDHRVKSGLINHPSGICLQVVRRILASLSLVQSHIRPPLPTICKTVLDMSSVLQCRKRGDVVMLIRCNRACVGQILCMARYQIIFISSVTRASCRLCHTRTQSVSGHRRWTLITGGSGFSLRGTTTMV